MSHDLIIIPGGCTSLQQPLNICINWPFKSNLQQSYTQWVAIAVYETTPTGRMKKPALSSASGSFLHGTLFWMIWLSAALRNTASLMPAMAVKISFHRMKMMLKALWEMTATMRNKEIQVRNILYCMIISYCILSQNTEQCFVSSIESANKSSCTILKQT